MENPIEAQINGPDPPPSSEDALRAELDSLRRSHQILQSKTAAMESDLSRLQSQRDEAAARNEELKNLVAEVSGDRDSLRRSFEAREQEFRLKIEQLETERDEREGFLVNCLDSLSSVKERLVRVTEIVSDDKAGDEIDSIEEERSTESSELDRKLSILEEIRGVVRLAESAEVKVGEYREMRNNERKQLGNSVVSLTEENRDISTLLRIALVEKEAVEKRLKGSGEHKRVAILQRVGLGSFGFFGGNEHAVEGGAAAKVEGVGTGSGNKSDSSECEEEVVSLASTVEKIMKNLRLEITQLRRSLEESRSDTERLQSLTEKQAQEIAENMLYIKELEDRERELVQNVEELTIEVKETEAEVARWREACELEVAAGKNEIEEREKVIAILKQELEKTRASLDISNGKLKLKEELAATAMAAHAAAEKSLQLADSRAAGLRDRIEELSKQIEEAESKERNSRRVRHICWPWRTLKVNPASNRTVRRFLPEMQALLNYSG